MTEEDKQLDSKFFNWPNEKGSDQNYQKFPRKSNFTKFFFPLQNQRINWIENYFASRTPVSQLGTKAFIRLDCCFRTFALPAKESVKGDRHWK